MIITGYGDVSTEVKAMKAGAVDFIEKPLDKKSFVPKIKSILKENTVTYTELSIALTKTEKKVLQLVLNGMSNIKIAALLNRSTRTIEVHRNHIMYKLGVNNLTDLVKRVISMGLIELGENPNLDEDKQKY